MLLKVKNISKKYGKKVALNNSSFYFEAGKIYGLIGPNGCGKTTLIKCINQLLVPDSGEILFEDKILDFNAKASISYLPERTYLDRNKTLNFYLNLFADFYEDFDRQKAIDMAARLKIVPTDKIGTLSKGMKEKVQLILVMSRNAKLYILDEPIAGVDPAARDFIIKTILENRDENSSIIICTHLLTDIEDSLDYVYMMNGGEIFKEGDTSKLKEEYGGKTIDAIFREEFKW